MEFILLFSVSVIPLICGGVIFIKKQNFLNRSITCFLLFLSLWQIDISFLYAGDWLNKEQIEIIFRALRLGPILIMPMMHYFAGYLYKQVADPATGRSKPLYRRLLGRNMFFALLGFSLLVYAVNWTNGGILSLSSYTYNSSLFPAHFIPVYGKLESFYSINVLLTVFFSIILLRLCYCIQKQAIKQFFLSLVFAVLIIFITGILAGLIVIPLYFSCFISIFSTIILFTSYFTLQHQIVERGIERINAQWNFLHIIIDLHPHYLYVISKSGQLLLMNEALTGLSQTKHWMPDERNRDPLIQQILHGNADRTPGIKEYMRKGSPSLYIKWSFIEVSYSNSEPCILATGVDVTKAKQEEARLVKSENLRVLGEMAAGIAHEIRNPLTSIKGFVKLLEESNTSRDKMYVSIISDEIDRINQVVSELLYMAKPQASIEKRIPFPVKKVIGEVKTLLEAAPGRPPVSIEITGDSWVCSSIEKMQLKQILINLLKNSMEALPSGGKIRIKVDHYNGNGRIRIIDNGTGISKEKAARLGEPFYTTKEKGTGLGLTICFKIIKQFHGTLVIKGKENWGTCVTILLPGNS